MLNINEKQMLLDWINTINEPLCLLVCDISDLYDGNVFLELLRHYLNKYSLGKYLRLLNTNILKNNIIKIEVFLKIFSEIFATNGNIQKQLKYFTNNSKIILMNDDLIFSLLRLTRTIYEYDFSTKNKSNDRIKEEQPPDELDKLNSKFEIDESESIPNEINNQNYNQLKYQQEYNNLKFYDLNQELNENNQKQNQSTYYNSKLELQNKFNRNMKNQEDLENEIAEIQYKTYNKSDLGQNQNIQNKLKEKNINQKYYGENYNYKIITTENDYQNEVEIEEEEPKIYNDNIFGLNFHEDNNSDEEELNIMKSVKYKQMKNNIKEKNPEEIGRNSNKKKIQQNRQYSNYSNYLNNESLKKFNQNQVSEDSANISSDPFMISESKYEPSNKPQTKFVPKFNNKRNQRIIITENSNKKKNSSYLESNSKCNNYNKNNLNMYNEKFFRNFQNENLKKIYNKKDKGLLDSVRGVSNFDKKIFNFEYKGMNIPYYKFTRCSDPIIETSFDDLYKYVPIFKKINNKEVINDFNNIINKEDELINNNQEIENEYENEDVNFVGEVDQIKYRKRNDDNKNNYIDNLNYTNDNYNINYNKPSKNRNYKHIKQNKSANNILLKQIKYKIPKENITFDNDIYVKDNNQETISYNMKNKIYNWLIEIGIIKPNIIKIENLPNICINGVLLCDLINRCEGRNEIIKGIIRKTTNRSHIIVNINKVLEYLRTVEKFNQRNLYSNMEIAKNNKKIIWELLEDIYNYYITKLGRLKRPRRANLNKTEIISELKYNLNDSNTDNIFKSNDMQSFNSNSNRKVSLKQKNPKNIISNKQSEKMNKTFDDFTYNKKVERNKVISKNSMLDNEENKIVKIFKKPKINSIKSELSLSPINSNTNRLLSTNRGIISNRKNIHNISVSDNKSFLSNYTTIKSNKKKKNSCFILFDKGSAMKVKNQINKLNQFTANEIDFQNFNN